MADRYRIIKALNIDALQPLVAASMADGWQPQGAPFQHSSSNTWCQAMTRAPQEEGVRLREPSR